MFYLKLLHCDVWPSASRAMGVHVNTPESCFRTQVLMVESFSAVTFTMWMYVHEFVPSQLVV